MSGGFSNTARKPRSRARSPSGVPGSVIATKRFPSGASSQKCARCESVSVVVPDLLATTKSVRSSSSASVILRIVAGCVVSRTISSSEPSATPNVDIRTSGASDEPPMPRSTAVSSPSAAARFANAIVLLLALVGPVSDILEGSARRGHWVLLAVLAGLAAGAKPTVLPVALAGTVVAGLAVARADRRAARSALWLAAVLGAFLTAGLFTVTGSTAGSRPQRSEEHTSELQSRQYLVCRLLLEKKTN